MLAAPLCFHSCKKLVGLHLAFLDEEPLQQRRRFFSTDAAVDFWRVVTGRLREYARAMFDAAALGIAGPKVKPPHARERDSRRAHGTGLKRHIEIAARKPLLTKGRAGRPDRDNFGVRGWVGQFTRAVTSFGEDFAIRPNNDRANRHFAARCGGKSLRQRHVHVA